MTRIGVFSAKCPVCGYEGATSQFHEKTVVRYWGGIQATVVRPKCPSCRANLRYRNKRLNIVMMLVVFGVLITVMAFFPKYLSHFGYAVAVIFLAVYLRRKFLYAGGKDIFEREVRGRE